MPLFGGSFLELPKGLDNPKKGLVNIHNKDNKCFLWCHVKHLNPIDDHSTRIKKKDKIIADTLNYSGISFPVSTRDYSLIEDQNLYALTFFLIKIKLFFQFTFLKRILIIL